MPIVPTVAIISPAVVLTLSIVTSVMKNNALLVPFINACAIKTRYDKTGDHIEEGRDHLVQSSIELMVESVHVQTDPVFLYSTTISNCTFSGVLCDGVYEW